jgi:hypothetical protein
VLFSPKKPKAKKDHLSDLQGIATATGMAPLKKQRQGWMRLSRIFLANYGFHLSRSHATPTQETDYAGVSEAVGLSAPAECHYYTTMMAVASRQMSKEQLADWLQMAVSGVPPDIIAS